jgi:hypothetical protein
MCHLISCLTQLATNLQRKSYLVLLAVAIHFVTWMPELPIPCCTASIDALFRWAICNLRWRGSLGEWRWQYIRGSLLVTKNQRREGEELAMKYDVYYNIFVIRVFGVVVSCFLGERRFHRVIE